MENQTLSQQLAEIIENVERTAEINRSGGPGSRREAGDLLVAISDQLGEIMDGLARTQPWEPVVVDQSERTISFYVNDERTFGEILRYAQSVLGGVDRLYLRLRNVYDNDYFIAEGSEVRYFATYCNTWSLWPRGPFPLSEQIGRYYVLAEVSVEPLWPMRLTDDPSTLIVPTVAGQPGPFPCHE